MENQTPKYTVYTIQNCPYCVRAKQLLDSLNISYKEIFVKYDDDETRIFLLEKTGMKSFPQILFEDELIGGFTELDDLNNKIGLLNFNGARK